MRQSDKCSVMMPALPTFYIFHNATHIQNGGDYDITLFSSFWQKQGEPVDVAEVEPTLSSAS